MITIDGSLGEGGGQVLRSALSLSLATGEPFRMTRIRAGRKKPGLLRQHLTATRAAAEVGGARTEGAELGSGELVFEPDGVRPGEYHHAVGTAGSACLVLQTVLPPLLTAEGPSTLRIGGGTHNPFAPPFDFLSRSYLPQLAKMGARVTAELVRPGFYPAGGGEIVVNVDPVPRLEPTTLLERGEPVSRRAEGMVASLPVHIAKRETKLVRRKLGWSEDETEVVTLADSPGPGNVLILALEYENVTEVVTGFGETNTRAEKVAELAIKEVRRYLAKRAPVGRRLADQLLLPLALAGGGSFLTLPLTRHSTTNIEIIRAFLPIDVNVVEEEDGCVLVTVTARP